jgi:hypothetical protein
VTTIQHDLQQYLEKEEIKWRQRAKTNWLTFGDKNSKYFHACANQRRKVNKISYIQDERGAMWKSQKEIGRAFMEYFEGLFATEGLMIDHGCLDALEGRLRDVMNALLIRPFTDEVVKATFFQMSPLKAPRPVVTQIFN